MKILNSNNCFKRIGDDFEEEKTRRHEKRVKSIQSNQQKKQEPTQQQQQREEDNPPHTHTHAGSNGRRVSWCSVNTFNLLHSSSSSPLLLRSTDFESLLRPPVVEEKHLLNPVFKFSASLVDYVPRVRQDKTGRLYEQVNAMLASQASLRLYGLLLHFLYWTIIHPIAASSQQQHFYHQHHHQRQQTADGIANDDFDLLSLDSISSSKQQQQRDNENENKEEIDDENNGVGREEQQKAGNSSLSPADKETLYVQLEECLQGLKAEVRMPALHAWLLMFNT